MGRFFDKKPQAGMPISLQGLAKGLAGMAYALEHMSVENGKVDWSIFGAPTISFGDDGDGSSPAFIQTIEGVLLKSFGKMESPDYVLGRKSNGTIGWVETCTHASQHPESEY